MMDGVPGDVASSVVIAAAAAAGAGWQIRDGKLLPMRKPSQEEQQQGSSVMVVQSASSTVNPLINGEMYTVSGTSVSALLFSNYDPIYLGHSGGSMSCDAL